MKSFAGLVLLLVTLCGSAFAGPREDAAAVRAAWAEAFNAADYERVVALYSNDALFYGSTPPLFTGRDGVRSYFSHLPSGLKATMGEHTAVQVAPNVVLSSGLVEFTLPSGAVAPYRLTFALVQVNGQWLIAQHHASPVPKAPT
jgi:uncharacterized protein (TIGR02246 family)